MSRGGSVWVYFQDFCGNEHAIKAVRQRKYTQGNEHEGQRIHQGLLPVIKGLMMVRPKFASLLVKMPLTATIYDMYRSFLFPVAANAGRQVRLEAGVRGNWRRFGLFRPLCT
jgi:hypothetical protein